MIRSVVKCNYLVRVIDPDVAKSHFSRLDDLSIQTLCAKLNVSQSELSAVALTRLSLPTRFSGAGLHSFERLSPVAYLAGCSLALPLLLHLRAPLLRKPSGDRSVFSRKLERSSTRCFTWCAKCSGLLQETRWYARCEACCYLILAIRFLEGVLQLFQAAPEAATCVVCCDLSLDP